MSVESPQFDGKERLLGEVKRIVDKRLDGVPEGTDRTEFVEVVAQLFDPTGGLITSTSPEDLGLSLIQKALESMDNG